MTQLSKNQKDKDSLILASLRLTFESRAELSKMGIGHTVQFRFSYPTPETAGGQKRG